MKFNIHKIVVSDWLIILFAIIARLLYLQEYYGSVYFLEPIWDAQDYHNLALGLSHGRILPEMVFRAPLYPLFLGIIYMLLGPEALIPRLVQILIGVASCVLVKRIGDRIFGFPAGMLAGIAASLSGMMLYFDLELLPTSLVVFLYLLFIWEFLRMLDGEGSSVRTGVWFGLGVLIRPILLPFFPVALWWIWRVRKGWRQLIHFGVPVSALLLLSLFTHIVSGQGSVLVSAQGGVNFYIGNHHTSDGITARFPGVGAGWSWDTISESAQSQQGRTMSPGEIDRYYWKLGLAEVTDDPLYWVKRMLRKAVLFWNRTDISNNRDFYYHASEFPVFGYLRGIGFCIALPLALVGLVSGWRKRSARLLASFGLVYYLTTVFFFVNARFRHPLTPLLFVLAAGGLLSLINLISSRSKNRLKTVSLVGAALVAGIALPLIGDSGVDTKRWDYGVITEGMLNERLGRVDEAERLYKTALEINPRAPFVNFNLGELERLRMDYRSAVEYYQKEIAIQPQYAKALNNMGVAWTELGEEELAIAAYLKALEVQPGLRESAANAARIWGSRGFRSIERNDWRNARRCFKHASDLIPENPNYSLMLLKARFELADTVGVRRQLGELIEDHPGFPPAVDLLSRLDNILPK